MTTQTHWTARISPPIEDENLKQTSYADWISGWAKQELIITTAPQLDSASQMEGSEDMYRALNNAGMQTLGITVDITKNDEWEDDMFSYLEDVGDGYPRHLKTIQEVYDWKPTHSIINEIFDHAYPNAKFAWPTRSNEEWINGLQAWLLEREGLLVLNRSYYPK